MRVLVRARSLVGAAAAMSIAITGCTNVDDDPVTGEGREAAVYATILGWMLDGEPDVGTDERPAWTMFVASRYEQPISVEVQVLVVEALDERIVVRFIDERAEALDAGADGEPVREGGILVGLGAVPPEGNPVDVYVDRYRDADDVEAWEVTVRRTGGTWRLVGVPAATDVRPLPGLD